ncbi:hypothetical protein DERP_014810 [Dermatophagoides pteronyssinus]|uniref:Uncharacterized protein n=1 Tax=Dermatophagoides pteronyssinus TaxID=6956 RepID=A0ABQ8J2G1_DERPT|nr:hypothetical protein DERP_014810 [Dermatophagoides pteronyssinus]
MSNQCNLIILRKSNIRRQKCYDMDHSYHYCGQTIQYQRQHLNQTPITLVIYSDHLRQGCPSAKFVQCVCVIYAKDSTLVWCIRGDQY